MKSVHYLKASTSDLDKIQGFLILGFCAEKAKSTVNPEKKREIEDLFLKIFEENEVKFKDDNFSIDNFKCSLNYNENCIKVTSDDLIKV